jgi:hypothetical protein
MDVEADQNDGRHGLLASAWRHLLHSGVLSLLIATGRLILIQGLSVAVLFLFVAPPLVALLLIHRSQRLGPRLLAHTFLLLLVIGVVVAQFPAVLPKLGGFNRALPIEADRLLSWYSAVYTLFLMGIGPTAYFVSNYLAHRRGEPAELSRLTCVLGLFTMTLVCLVLPRLLGALLGLWPLPG